MELHCNKQKNPNQTTDIYWFLGTITFVGFIGTSTILLILWLVEPRLKAVSELLWFLVASLTSVFLMGSVIAILFFFIFRNITFGAAYSWKWITFFFNVSLGVVKNFGYSGDKLARGAIAFSNYSFCKKNIKLYPNEVLILIPHCIQKDTCNLKVTVDAQNCQRCGLCNVGELAEIERKFGVHLAIVTGGTLARKKMKEIRPKAVLAIACERDLISGIQDVFPIPVFGILNMRPFGPCINTQVDISLVERALQDIIKE